MSCGTGLLNSGPALLVQAPRQAEILERHTRKGHELSQSRHIEYLSPSSRNSAAGQTNSLSSLFNHQSLTLVPSSPLSLWCTRFCSGAASVRRRCAHQTHLQSLNNRQALPFDSGSLVSRCDPSLTKNLYGHILSSQQLEELSDIGFRALSNDKPAFSTSERRSC